MTTATLTTRLTIPALDDEPLEVMVEYSYERGLVTLHGITAITQGREIDVWDAITPITEMEFVEMCFSDCHERMATASAAAGDGVHDNYEFRRGAE